MKPKPAGIPDRRDAARLAAIRTQRVRIGGMGKDALLAELARHGIELNGAARTLFAHERFTILARRRWVETVEITVAALGLARGATLTQIIDQARAAGLFPCPLELAPHLRLQHLDQVEGPSARPDSSHRAPPGSITVASIPLAMDEPMGSGSDVPTGFYLRRVEGVLWLRGYRCDEAHVWSPADHFVFQTSRARA